MMTEQQMTLKKSDDLQDRWKICIKTTCVAMRVIKSADKIKELFETIIALIKNLATKISEAFTQFKDFICDRVSVYLNYDIPISPKSRSKRPSYTDRVSVNVRGFSKPILCRARSNCRK